MLEGVVYKKHELHLTVRLPVDGRKEPPACFEISNNDFLLVINFVTK